MASGYTSIFLPLLILFVATASVAQAGSGIFGIIYQEITLKGVFAVPSIIPPVNVYLSCDGGLSVLSGALDVSDANGAYLVVAPIGNDLLFDQFQCSLYVRDVVSAKLYSCGLGNLQLQLTSLLGLGGLAGTFYNPGPFLPVLP